LASIVQIGAIHFMQFDEMAKEWLGWWFHS